MSQGNSEDQCENIVWKCNGTILLISGCQTSEWALSIRTSNVSWRGCGKVIKRYYLKLLRQSGWRTETRENVCGTVLYRTVDTCLKRKECLSSFTMDYYLSYCLRLYVNELSMWKMPSDEEVWRPCDRVMKQQSSGEVDIR